MIKIVAIDTYPLVLPVKSLRRARTRRYFPPEMQLLLRAQERAAGGEMAGFMRLGEQMISVRSLHGKAYSTMPARQGSV
jgi:hypothetical protein